MKDSPILALMKEYGAPLTRDEYFRWTNLGKTGKVSAEEEGELPERFAYPVISHETLPEEKPKGKDKEKSEGAPVDFAGPVFSNPNRIKPRLDTYRKPVHPTRQVAPLGPPPMNIDNAPLDSGIEPNPMVPREQ